MRDQVVGDAGTDQSDQGDGHQHGRQQGEDRVVRQCRRPVGHVVPPHRHRGPAQRRPPDPPGPVHTGLWYVRDAVRCRGRTRRKDGPVARPVPVARAGRRRSHDSLLAGTDVCRSTAALRSCARTGHPARTPGRPGRLSPDPLRPYPDRPSAPRRFCRGCAPGIAGRPTKAPPGIADNPGRGDQRGGPGPGRRPPGEPYGVTTPASRKVGRSDAPARHRTSRQAPTPDEADRHRHRHCHRDRQEPQPGA